jgi:hypothetical protein
MDRHGRKTALHRIRTKAETTKAETEILNERSADLGEAMALASSTDSHTRLL